MIELQGVVLMTDLCNLVDKIKDDPSVAKHKSTAELVAKCRGWTEVVATDPPTPAALPGWLPLAECKYCGVKVFFAKNSSNTWLPMCPQPVEAPENTVFLDCAYVSFSGGQAHVVRGRLGTQWLVHRAICGKPRPTDPTIGAIWDANYALTRHEEDVAVGSLLEAINELG